MLHTGHRATGLHLQGQLPVAGILTWASQPLWLQMDHRVPLHRKQRAQVQLQELSGHTCLSRGGWQRGVTDAVLCVAQL